MAGGTTTPGTGAHPDVSFKGVSTAATAAVKWLALGRDGLPSDGSVMQHNACTIIERQTMSRAFPTGRAVLQRFFEVVELQVGGWESQAGWCPRLCGSLGGWVSEGGCRRVGGCNAGRWQQSRGAQRLVKRSAGWRAATNFPPGPTPLRRLALLLRSSTPSGGVLP